MVHSDRAAALGLAAGALVLYLGWGLAFDRHAPDAFRDNDRVFDADTPNRIICLTRPEGAHYLTRLHPLFVILLNPAGLALRGLLELLGLVARPGRVAALGLTSAAGAVGVAALFLLLRRAGLERLFALLWALVFALSSSQTFWGVVPETFVFSGASLLVLLLAWAPPRASGPLRAAAGVVAFGTAATNLALVGLLPFLERARGLGERVRWVSRHLALVVVTTGALSLVQHQLYPRTVYFFARGGVPSDDLRNFLPLRTAAEVGSRSAELASHLLLANLVAPRFEVTGADTPRPAILFGPASLAAHRVPGLAFAVLWAALLALALARGGLPRHPVVLALLAWVGLHAALHFVFGTQLFLYSCQWTFAVVTLAALAGQRTLDRTPRSRRPLAAALVALAVLAAANNTLFLREVLAVFAPR
jgi:hypothetical protein